jgi:hypothetical protein
LSTYLSAPENKASKTSFSRPFLALRPSCEPVKVLAPTLHHHKKQFEEEKKSKGLQRESFGTKID